MFTPRFFRAWDFHGSFIPTPRSAAGLYTYNFSSDNYGSGLGAATSSSGGVNDSSNGIYPTTKFGGLGTLYPLGGGTAAPLPYTAASQDPTRFNGQNASYNEYNTPIPKIYQWNLGIEQQVGTNLAFTVSYVGSHGLNLTFPTNLNAIPTNQLSSNDASGCGSGSSTNCAAAYPIYNQINGNLYNAISNYHSLQTTITKRLSSGLSFSANYTWSHFLDDQDSSGWGTHAGPQPYQVPSTLTANNAYLNYGPSNFDVRNAFKAYTLYQLPFGKGKQFFNHNWLTDATIGGLQVSGTVVADSGNPFQVTATNNTYAQGGSHFPNKTGISTRPIGQRTIANWYNPAAFSNPANGTFGNAGRNPVVGPGFYTVNLSAAKAFNLPWEGIKFSLRADAANAFNHATFSAPQGQLASPDANGVFQSTSNSATAGQITGYQIGGRNVQLGARLSF